MTEEPRTNQRSSAREIRKAQRGRWSSRLVLVAAVGASIAALLLLITTFTSLDVHAPAWFSIVASITAAILTASTAIYSYRTLSTSRKQLASAKEQMDVLRAASTWVETGRVYSFREADLFGAILPGVNLGMDEYGR
jgi:VIT1/CCC1 family predicted Fe2+/Mn2+ transporter